YSPRRMDAESTTPSGEFAVQGYAREAVDDFLAAAQAERARLLELIAEAEARTRRARAAVGIQRVIAAILPEAQVQIEEGRRATAAEVEAILAVAENDARSLPGATSEKSEPTIDLVLAESIDGRAFAGGAAVFRTFNGRGPSFGNGDGDDPYLAY